VAGDRRVVLETTFRDETAEVYGRGLYQNDTLFYVGNNRGSDIVALFMGVPLFAVSAFLYARGSFRAPDTAEHPGLLSLHVDDVRAGRRRLQRDVPRLRGAVRLEPVRVRPDLPNVRSPNGHPGVLCDMPRRLAGTFLFASGVVTLGIWLMDPLASLLVGETPKGLDTHTTLFTPRSIWL
jgi:hypothetical protein